jgi:hypothetical protein
MFDKNDPEHVAAIQKLLIRKAERARTNIVDFVELVMREQVTKRRIKVAAHHRIGLDFMMAHPKCVMIWPAGAAKTYLAVAMTLWLIGRDPTCRGAVVSKTQELAKKILAVVRDYIDNSAELRMVFPHLAPMRGKWSEESITVERPPGIPDPSLVALGIGGSILGSRLSWAIADDVLDLENTSTPEARKKTIDFILSSVLSRQDPADFRFVLNNTAWHPEDAVHYFAHPQKGKMPSLRMTITGDVVVGDDPHRVARGKPAWDHDLLRPKHETGHDYSCRIVRPGIDDSKNDVPLFPERFFYVPWEDDDGNELPPASTMAVAIERARQDIENKRRDFGPIEFNRAFMGIARDDESAFCKVEWIEACKKAARSLGYNEMASRYTGSQPTFTGVDLAVGLGEEHDYTVFFTFVVLEDRRRLILDVEIGRWKGPVIVEKLVQKQKAYKSIVRVENNGAQEFLRQQAIHLDASIPIKAHTTGRTKAHPEYGVPGGFIEMANGAWLIPNDKHGNVHPHVQHWIDGCLYYAPTKHTNDAVMAWYFARQQAAEWGLLGPKRSGAGAPSVSNLLTR